MIFFLQIWHQVSSFFKRYKFLAMFSPFLLSRSCERRKLSFPSSPHLAICIFFCESQHRWMPLWWFFHLSNFWLISQLHYTDACLRSSTQHTSLCANGLSASLRLRLQLRGDSLISHLAVLFLSCRVIMPEVDGWVRIGLYLKENAPEHFWTSRLLWLFAPVWFIFEVHFVPHLYEREPGDYVIMHMTEGVHWNNNKSFGGLVGLKMGF